ncbi:MAG: BREX-1 system phosphatase PglZ type A, partial [Verrucomicrobiota bacterium]
MDKPQIDTALNRLFHEQGKRVVFWNDPQREFEDTLAALAVPDIKVLRLDQEGALAVKIRVEREDPTGRYLIYSPTPEPDYDDDWLLDIRLYSHPFRADRASIILDELSLANQALRPHIEERKKFFDNRERFKKLQSLVSPQDTEIDLDRKMLAVLLRADQPDPLTIVLALFHSLAGFRVTGVSYTQVRSKPGVLREDDGPGEPEDELLLHDKGEPDLGTPPPAWDMVAKLGLDGPFWQMVKTTFGYAEETPSLRNLLIRLLLTDYAHHLNGGLPFSMQHLVLPPTAKQNVVACLSHWRDSASRGSSYDRLSSMVADILKLDSHLDSLDIDALLNVMTFLPVEKAIARSLRDRVRHTADSINAEDIRKIAQRRQDGHWASLGVTGLPTVPRKALHAVYDALVAAADFFALRNQYRGQFDFA